MRKNNSRCKNYSIFSVPAERKNYLIGQLFDSFGTPKNSARFARRQQKYPFCVPSSSTKTVPDTRPSTIAPEPNTESPTLNQRRQLRTHCVQYVPWKATAVTSTIAGSSEICHCSVRRDRMTALQSPAGPNFKF